MNEWGEVREMVEKLTRARRNNYPNNVHPFTQPHMRSFICVIIQFRISERANRRRDMKLVGHIHMSIRVVLGIQILMKWSFGQFNLTVYLIFINLDIRGLASFTSMQSKSAFVWTTMLSNCSARAIGEYFLMTFAGNGSASWISNKICREQIREYSKESNYSCHPSKCMSFTLHVINGKPPPIPQTFVTSALAQS